jgi:hypothetical protein
MPFNPSPKMKTITLLLAIFALVQTDSSGQNRFDKQINIIATTSVAGKEYQIQIQTSSDSIQVLTRILDSTSTKVEDDLEYKEVRKQLLSKKSIDLQDQKTSKLIKRLKQISDSYKIFTEELISIPNEYELQFLKQIEDIFATPTDSLTKKQQSIITIDGTFTQFKLTDSQGSREFNLRFSSGPNYPEIKNLLKTTKHIIKLRSKNEKISKYQF